MASLEELANRYEVYPQWPHINYMKLAMLEQIVTVEEVDEDKSPSQDDPGE